MTRYYHPDEFRELKRIAMGMGFVHVEAGPLVRSSYHAHEQADAGAGCTRRPAHLSGFDGRRDRRPLLPLNIPGRPPCQRPARCCDRSLQSLSPPARQTPKEDPRVAELQKELAAMKKDLDAGKQATPPAPQRVRRRRPARRRPGEGRAADGDERRRRETERGERAAAPRARGDEAARVHAAGGHHHSRCERQLNCRRPRSRTVRCSRRCSKRTSSSTARRSPKPARW